MASFHCSVVTPERVVLETEARFVALPAHDGEVGILPGRAPLLVALGVGRLRVQSADGEQVLHVPWSGTATTSRRVSSWHTRGERARVL